MVVAYFTVGPGAEAGATARAADQAAHARTKAELAQALTQIDKLTSGLETLKVEIKKRSSAQDTISAAIDNEPPPEPSRAVGGPWERGPKKQRSEEAEECAGWLDGSRDTYYHDKDAKKHVLPGGYTAQYKQDKALFKKFFKVWWRCLPLVPSATQLLPLYGARSALLPCLPPSHFPKCVKIVW